MYIGKSLQDNCTLPDRVLWKIGNWIQLPVRIDIEVILYLQQNIAKVLCHNKSNHLVPHLLYCFPSCSIVSLQLNQSFTSFLIGLFQTTSGYNNLLGFILFLTCYSVECKAKSLSNPCFRFAMLLIFWL